MDVYGLWEKKPPRQPRTLSLGGNFPPNSHPHATKCSLKKCKKPKQKFTAPRENVSKRIGVCSHLSGWHVGTQASSTRSRLNWRVFFLRDFEQKENEKSLLNIKVKLNAVNLSWVTFWFGRTFGLFWRAAI